MDVLLLLFALVGHAFVWIGLVNRLHSLGIRRPVIKRITLVCFGVAAVLPIGVGIWWTAYGGRILGGWSWHPGGLAVRCYLGVCWLAAVATLVRLVHLRALSRPPVVVRSHRRQWLEVRRRHVAAGETPHHFLTRLPRNEILSLELAKWALDVPRLPRPLNGMTIVHLSDLHFTGRIGKSYFHEIIRLSNELEPDLVAITGDLVDDAVCLDWIPQTIGRLRARHGVYFVLGNHDLLADPDRLRGILAASGLIDVGGRWIQVEVRGQAVILAGNELPWHGPAADMCNCPPRIPGNGPLRIVLAHSPDQFAWARASDADLILAGHTHGGQIRIPPLGAIFSPTLEGVKYISGMFYEPPTILHVSRGISGDVPVRLNCPPEMSLLRLHAPAAPGNHSALGEK